MKGRKLTSLFRRMLPRQSWPDDTAPQGYTILQKEWWCLIKYLELEEFRIFNEMVRSPYTPETLRLLYNAYKMCGMQPGFYAVVVSWEGHYNIEQSWERMQHGLHYYGVVANAS